MAVNGLMAPVRSGPLRAAGSIEPGKAKSLMNGPHLLTRASSFAAEALELGKGASISAPETSLHDHRDDCTTLKPSQYPRRVFRVPLPQRGGLTLNCPSSGTEPPN